MKVYISADIEGCSGLVNWGQCGGPGTSCYDWPFARRMMTHDVNAAIRGARAAGAERVVVKDSHNAGRNLLLDELEPGTELLSGTVFGADGMCHGVGEGFDAALLVGYHARAGTPAAVMEHTFVGGVHRLWVNGVEAGEIYLSAASCGRHGVPVAAVVSDDAGCAEARDLLPDVRTASTKQGLGRYLAVLRSLEETGADIEATVREALAERAPRPFDPGGAQTLRLETKSTEEADAVAELAGWVREGGYLLSADAPDWESAHQRLLSAFLNIARAPARDR